jgi:O-methyltransferase domain/Dimerisation domain
MSAQPGAVPPHVQVLQILGGAQVAGAVCCLAKLGVPDLVESGPKSAEELAKQLGADPGALYRLMRATASVGVLVEGADGKFSQTPLSTALRSDSNPSLRALAIMGITEWHMRGWTRLEYSVRTGKTALDEVYGMSMFEHFAQTPADAQIFNDAMTNISMMDAPAVAATYSFEGIGSVVDVAGGHGLLLATILGRNPNLKGTLFDAPHVVEGAKEGPLKPFLSRCTLAGGDMFASVPAGADAYMMKHIIHDWPDDLCIKLLKLCRKAVNPGGKLLVLDHVIEPGNNFSPAKFLDLQMLLFPGGMERTEKQFSALFAASGWRLNRIVPTPNGEAVVEGLPA